ncbi:MAG: CdvA-like protein, partial [Fervidicoccaceae archaeon]
MLVYTVDVLERYVGQKVKDPYGRTVGTLASIYSDFDGRVQAVEMLFGETTFKTIDVGRIMIQSGEVLLLPEWKFAALRLIERLERSGRRAKALEDLYAKGEIPRHAYEEFKAKVSSELEKLKTEAKEVKVVIERRIGELEDQIVQAEKALAALKMSYIAGEIGERSYKPAADILRQGRDRNIEEKNDAKRILEVIRRLESGEIEREVQQPAKVERQAEPQIVVELVQEGA